MILTIEPADAQPSRPDDLPPVPGRKRLRGPNGKYIASGDTAALDAFAVKLRARAMGFAEIAHAMGEGETTAKDRVARGLGAIRMAPAVELVKLEVAKLDAIEREALRVLETFHYVVSEGRVISYQGPKQTEPRPLKDDGPVLSAIDRLLKVGEARRKLLGLDAAQKVDLSGGVTYTFENVSSEDL